MSDAAHERFARLGGEPLLGERAGFFERLLAAEARHGELFLQLAHEVASADEVARRWTELAEEEARLLAAAAPGPRIHSGWAGLATAQVSPGGSGSTPRPSATRLM